MQMEKPEKPRSSFVASIQELSRIVSNLKDATEFNLSLSAEVRYADGRWVRWNIRTYAEAVAFLRVSSSVRGLVRLSPLKR